MNFTEFTKLPPDSPGTLLKQSKIGRRLRLTVGNFANFQPITSRRYIYARHGVGSNDIN